jgi:hypothetical protein
MVGNRAGDNLRADGATNRLASRERGVRLAGTGVCLGRQQVLERLHIGRGGEEVAHRHERSARDCTAIGFEALTSPAGDRGLSLLHRQVLGDTEYWVHVRSLDRGEIRGRHEIAGFLLPRRARETFSEGNAIACRDASARRGQTLIRRTRDGEREEGEGRCNS